MVATGSAAWNTNNPVFNAYAFYSGLLILKVLAMSTFTAIRRFSNGVFASPEDRFMKGSKVGVNIDPDVERVRRAHQNDIENIFPFLTAGLLYVATGPSPTFALNLFRVVFVSRVLHTLVYAFGPVPQPARAIAWFVAYVSIIYMTVSSVMFFNSK